ncbi:hypothetical protein [uncultured Pseudacidovorax sp.]|uniref:hypothetical protein n=1 Tax=uncultured Pseudacidovorax sp. TaxID=679313 RepID=UPI0025CF5895|nr:hypothetical protein [uncultured Pseudacidovorax sp.]
MRSMSVRGFGAAFVLLGLVASMPPAWAQAARAPSAVACALGEARAQKDTALLHVGGARAVLALLDAAADPAALVGAANVAGANLVLAFDWPEPALKQAREALAMPLGALRTRPAVPSRLLSAGPEGLRTSSFQVGERDVVVLLQQGAHGLVRVSASVVADDVAGHRRTVRWHAGGDDNAAGARADLATLEQLYRLVLEQSPEDRFVLHLGSMRARPAMGYADALAALAQARECAAGRVRTAASGPQPLAWQSVRVTLAKASAAQPLAVAARALDTAGRPVADAQISFARGEHFVCSAPTDAQGWARCTLWDPHGHVLEDDGRDSTLVTFGGQWQEARLLLPTTAVFRARFVGSRSARHVH